MNSRMFWVRTVVARVYCLWVEKVLIQQCSWKERMLTSELLIAEGGFETRPFRSQNLGLSPLSLWIRLCSSEWKGFVCSSHFLPFIIITTGTGVFETEFRCVALAVTSSVDQVGAELRGHLPLPPECVCHDCLTRDSLFSGVYERLCEVEVMPRLC